MSKYPVVFFFAGLLIGSLGVNWAAFDCSSIMSSFQDGSFLPKMKTKFEEFKISFMSSPKPCREYGSLKLMESLDDGKLWPHQRRKMRHTYLDKMIKQVDSFPSAQEKQQKIKRLGDRIEQLERKCYGRRKV